MSRARRYLSSIRLIRDRWMVLFIVIAALAFVAPLAFAAKGGNPGKPDGSGSGSSVKGPSVTVSGVITNSITGQGISGASVTFLALNATFSATTGANGTYSLKVAANASYDVTFEATNYLPATEAGSIVKNKDTTLDKALEPIASVIVTANVSGSPEPGETLSATATCTVMDGSSILPAYTGWTQTDGVPAVISDPLNDTTAVTLGTISKYAAHLVDVLKAPPITEADLPPDIVLQPINQIEKGLQDRNQVVAINPLGLETAEDIPLRYTCTTDSGSYAADVSVVTQLPWVVNTGVRTVPVNVPVMLLAKCGDELDQSTGVYECIDQTAFSWQITDTPDGSNATLTNANTRSPWFTPDVVGTYRIQETNGSGANLDVHAGRYRGVIDPVLTLNSVVFGDGRPVADENCTGCHTEGGAAPDNFTPWRQTGHAEAFTQGITTNDHFSEHCFACHSVGFERDNAGGIDDTPNYENFLQLLADNQAADDIAGTWETMLMAMPDTARLSNIQCENCHGPQDYTEAHRNQPGAPRVSLASDVCGSCHGEPARHGRFQQWQLSNHADYDLARERGASSGNCARCHSGNGFVAWNQVEFDPDTDVVVTWDQDSVHPQTCPTCHNPHDTGTTSGSDETNAKVRIMGNTHPLIAGFTATGVGKGATCMTCHNSRRGLRNDNTWDGLSDSEKDDIPHHGVQADLVMGQNAYFFAQNELVRGKHSLIEDVCVTCHMNKTDPPAILSYNNQGTNHTFAADPNICSECHGEGVTAASVQTVINGYLDDLSAQLSADYMALMTANYAVTIDGCGVADDANPITAVVWERPDRLDITLQDGSMCDNRNPRTQISTPGGTLFELSAAAYAGALEKAGWNYYLVYEDEGRGVHNPDFSIKALTRAIAAISP